VLKYFYYGEAAIDMLSACELFPFTKDFKLTKLCGLLEKIIGGQDITIATCLPVLDVAYNPLMNENNSLQVKLKLEGLDFAVSNLETIDFKPLEFMSPQISSHILQRLQQTIGPKWGMLAGAAGWNSGSANTEDGPPEEDGGSDKKTKKKDKRERKNTAKMIGVPTSDSTNSEIGEKSEVDTTATSSSKKKKREKKQDKGEKEAAEGKGGADEEDAGGAAETGADDKA